jgi:hypothetical protein
MEANDVPSGISSFTLSQAFCVEIQEMPTREMTSVSLNENKPPTRVEVDEDEAKPPGCSILLAAPVAVNVLLLVAAESK